MSSHWDDQQLWIKMFGIYVGLELVIYGYNATGFGDVMNQFSGSKIWAGKKE